MLVEEKPPLDELYMAHWGVKGMRWGVRKSSSSDSSGGSSTKSSQTDDRGFVITPQQKRKAIAIAGIGAVGGVLYATGNLKAAAVGGSKLAMQGAVAGTKIVAKVGAYTVKTVAQTIGVVIGTTAKGAGDIVKKTVETVANQGGVAPSAKASLWSRRPKLSDLAAKLKPNTSSPKLASARTFFSRKPQEIQLYPTESIFSRGRGKVKVTDLSDQTSKFTSFTDRLLRRGSGQ